MRCLEINKRVIYYALYEGKIPVVDGDGYRTGEYTLGYGKPVKMRVNVSPGKGEATRQQFGVLEEYDKVLITDQLNCPVDEESVLWIDGEPALTPEGELELDGSGAPLTPWDYLVTRVARGLYSTAYAVKKVSAGG